MLIIEFVKYGDLLSYLRTNQRNPIANIIGMEGKFVDGHVYVYCVCTCAVHVHVHIICQRHNTAPLTWYCRGGILQMPWHY